MAEESSTVDIDTANRNGKSGKNEINLVPSTFHLSDTITSDDENGDYSYNKMRNVAQTSFPCSFKRYLLAFIVVLAFIAAYSMRFNLNLEFREMVLNMQGNSSVSVGENNRSNIKVFHYLWEPHLQGFALSVFFYGYTAMQIPGGWLAHKFGGFSILSFSMLVSGILTLLEPILITTGYAAFIICRILIGVAQGPIYPAMIEFWKEWSHPNDRARMVTTTEIGASIGTIFAMILPSVIVQRLNWSSPFYCFGIIGIAWPILWIAVSSRTPRSHNCSCMNEVSVGKESDEACMPEYNEIPWKLIFTSLPVYAYAIAFFCEGWILFTALTHIPKFLLLHREYDITHTGIKCIIPFIGQMIMLFISGFLSDLFISRDYLKPTIVRKGIYVIGNVISAACLITIGFLDDLNAALICLFTTIIIDGATRSVMLVNPLDLASPYAGFIMGIGHAACNLAGCICPLMAGHITESMAIERWRFVFGITAGISLLGAVAYIVGGSAEEIEGISSMNNKNKYKSLPTADSENVHLLQKENASPGINDK